MRAPQSGKRKDRAATPTRRYGDRPCGQDDADGRTGRKRTKHTPIPLRRSGGRFAGKTTDPNKPERRSVFRLVIVEADTAPKNELIMIKITFPDGSVKEFAEGTTDYRIAESLSPSLAAESLSADR